LTKRLTKNSKILSPSARASCLTPLAKNPLVLGKCQFFHASKNLRLREHYESCYSNVVGVHKSTATLLCNLSQRGLLNGALLQLGVQSISREAKDLIMQTFKSASQPNLNEFSSGKKRFWHSLGFDEVKSLDFNDFEGAEIICDLNKPVESTLRDRFDVVFDGGTLEHIFDTKAALLNIDSLLVDGGLIIHEVPSSNAIDHGFYSFSPTFFQDFYPNQGYEIIELLLVVSRGRRAKIYQYSTPPPRKYIRQNWGNKTVNVWCVARKSKSLNYLNSPQQTKYLNAWSRNSVNFRNSQQVAKVHKLRENIKQKFNTTASIIGQRYPLVAELSRLMSKRIHGFSFPGDHKLELLFRVKSRKETA
jgi:hypothetical protein